jgi:hypothetical protein
MKRPSGENLGDEHSPTPAVKRRATPPLTGTDHRSSSHTKTMVSPAIVG